MIIVRNNILINYKFPIYEGFFWPMWHGIHHLYCHTF